MKLRNQLSIVILTAILVGLWQFPNYWYKDGGFHDDYLWFGEQNQIDGWEYNNLPLSEATEAVLAADKMIYGEFRATSGEVVQVFSAKRYVEKENAISLFSHTPDRCWTNSGLTIVPEQPFFVRRKVHGVNLILERRVFSFGSRRELVYFGGIVGGKPLPFRMNQFLLSGMSRKDRGDEKGALGRLGNSRVWSWALESFTKRIRLAGPQQLIRISTPINKSIKNAEMRLNKILENWLVLVSYADEKSYFEENQNEQ